MEDLCQQFKQAEHSYKEATEDRRIAFETLSAADKHCSEMEALQMKRLQKIQV